VKQRLKWLRIALEVSQEGNESGVMLDHPVVKTSAKSRRIYPLKKKTMPLTIGRFEISLNKSLPFNLSFRKSFSKCN
jgi:hypothetical protein